MHRVYDRGVELQRGLMSHHARKPVMRMQHNRVFGGLLHTADKIVRKLRGRLVQSFVGQRYSTNTQRKHLRSGDLIKFNDVICCRSFSCETQHLMSGTDQTLCEVSDIHVQASSVTLSGPCQWRGMHGDHDDRKLCAQEILTWYPRRLASRLKKNRDTVCFPCPDSQSYNVRGGGLEPPRAIKLTATSTLRVYQFRHPRWW